MQAATINRIGVFCAASLGKNQCYSQVTQQFSQAMIDAKLSLVYGGTEVGLMKLLADHLMANHREVIGVIPKFLVDAGIISSDLTKCYIVDSMAQRKKMMFDLADAYVLLPGGFGSLDEFFEVVALTQLGIHNKPCAILNVNGYYDSIMQFIDGAVDAGFIRAEYKKMIIIDDCPYQLLSRLNNHCPPQPKWDKAPNSQQPVC